MRGLPAESVRREGEETALAAPGARPRASPIAVPAANIAGSSPPVRHRVHRETPPHRPTGPRVAWRARDRSPPPGTREFQGGAHALDAVAPIRASPALPACS